MVFAIQSVSQLEETEIEIDLSDEKYPSLYADESFLQDGALNPNIEIISLDSKESEKEHVESNKLSIDSLDKRKCKSRDKCNLKFNISSKIYDSWRQCRPFNKEKALLIIILTGISLILLLLVIE